MVAAVMAVVHMAACMAVPPPAWPPALPSRTFVLVLVLVLVLGDSAIGGANDALGHAGHAGFYVMVQYSVSQLCNELQKLESWSAADP